MVEIEIEDTFIKFRSEDNKEIYNFDWFILNLSKGNWERRSFEIFKQFSDQNKIALDFGAWIGATSIWMSKNFKQVYSFEPDPVAYDALIKNLELNECNNTLPLKKAIYSSNTELGLKMNDKFLLEGFGASTSQIDLMGSDVITKTTTFKDLSELIPFENVSFVKVDIEGAEEFIVEPLFKYASEFKWNVYVEIHESFMSRKGFENFNSTILKYSPGITDLGNHKLFEFT